MNNFQYTFLFLLTLCCSCTTCQFDEIKTLATWENGQIKTIRYIGDFGELEEQYHANGQLAAEGLIVNEEKQKDWKYYYQNGQLREKVYYRENRPYGKVQTFYDNGQLKAEEEIDEMGHRIGSRKLYSKEGRVFKTETMEMGSSAEERNYYLPFAAYGMSDELTYVKPLSREEEINSQRERTIEQEFFSEKGQLIDQGKTYKNHDLFHWTFWYDHGQKQAEGQFLFAQDAITEPFIVDYPLHEEFADTYFGMKIGKWTYWNQAGKKVTIIEYQLNGNLIMEKVLYWKRKT